MSEEVVVDDLDRVIRGAAAAVARMVEVAQRRRAEQERLGRDAAIAQERDAERQFKQWVQQHREPYRQVGWHDWEDKATAGEWADAYTAARAMRDVDPSAVQAANRIEYEYQRRFGVDIRQAHDQWQDRAGEIRAEGVELQGKAVSPAALIEEHRPHYTAISEPGWADRATLPEWVNAYGHARVTVGLDPVAAMAAQKIEDEVQRRHGVDLKAAFDDAMQRHANGLDDLAADRAEQSQAEQQQAWDERERAEGLDDVDQRSAGEQAADVHDAEADDLLVDANDAQQRADLARGERAIYSVDVTGQAEQVYTKAAPAFTSAHEALGQTKAAKARKSKGRGRGKDKDDLTR